METIIIAVAIVIIAWIAWKVRTKSRATRDAELHQAWQTVLEDPDYAHRRRYEERMRQKEARMREDEQRTRKTEGL